MFPIIIYVTLPGKLDGTVGFMISCKLCQIRALLNNLNKISNKDKIGRRLDTNMGNQRFISIFL